jgi:hypothetical protein
MACANGGGPGQVALPILAQALPDGFAELFDATLTTRARAKVFYEKQFSCAARGDLARRELQFRPRVRCTALGEGGCHARVLDDGSAYVFIVGAEY